ncbi:MAG TPA: MotA/TolQ/ExbB proton channel family protein [Firmicutes bacterium]|nr:MotA/TolQ/ExbB proton channel family protein [Bacillota bacterium]
MLRIFVLGGPVMIPLLLCSIFALAIGIERLWYLLRSRIDTDDLLEDIKLSLGQGKVLEAMQIAKKSRGPVAAVLAAGIAHYDQGREEIKEHMSVTGHEEIHKMERRLGALDLIVTISPLLGILGTVTGIIGSFNVMGAMEGVTQASALSIGIAEALITTATGLIIAVPTMALTAYLNSIVTNQVADMNKKSTELLNVLDAGSEL